MTTFGIIIPDFAPTRTNALLGSHWAKAGRLKRIDREMIGGYFLVGRFPKATGKRRVRLRVVVDGVGRMGDPDGYLKSCLDALVKCGALLDDSARWCELETPVVERGDSPRTEIILTDL
jgi:hypothetical protein